MDDSDKHQAPTLQALGYQMYLVWREIERFPSWEKAIRYVDLLLEEAKHDRYVIDYYGDDVRGHAEGITAFAEEAIDSAIAGLEAEADVVRGIAIQQQHRAGALRKYVDLRVAVAHHPRWAFRLAVAGALSYSNDDERPYKWLWSVKDLIGLKPFLDYSWEQFAALFYHRGSPVKPTIRNNPGTEWRIEYPELLERILQ